MGCRLIKRYVARKADRAANRLIKRELKANKVKHYPWLRDAINAAQLVRLIRRCGNPEKLAIVSEKDMVEDRLWLEKCNKECNLMQDCIGSMIRCGTEGSPCCWCEECTTCTRPERENAHGCSNWWLRFLSVEEAKECEQKAAAASQGRAARNPQGTAADEDAENG